MNNWKIFQKDSEPHDEIKHLPPPPSWRRFSSTKGEVTEEEKRGATFQIREEEVELVNAALYLRRPLLVEGKPGTGKTSLAYAIAHQLSLGKVLRWNITTRSTLTEGLYTYDAVGRLQSMRRKDKNDSLVTAPANPSLTLENEQIDDIGKYVRLGALGTALMQSQEKKPRVLLIDEIDKSDIDLPNNLLHIFEEGEFEILELSRVKKEQPVVTVFTSENEEVEIEGGKIAGSAFPFVILTSNGERDFPPPFLRRCIRLTMPEPDLDRLKDIVQAHFQDEPDILLKAKPIIDQYQELRKKGQLATDQLLNTIYLVTRHNFPEMERNQLVEKLLQYLSNVL
ncbi:AAA family ATPase [Merismopedia glauca]|uniref:AAA family ATPase n=1 Tax=Merismopedia glauca CCAP 1448/3 TaxID=1296344 RepID=A0A2T1C0E4_9CYAN|nr:MoxR family ATPase [Merismopedia glauca]PSB01638.1 AAA family ATPase [Merismopedia glauca CCAP 1448/3]